MSHASSPLLPPPPTTHKHPNLPAHASLPAHGAEADGWQGEGARCSRAGEGQGLLAPGAQTMAAQMAAVLIGADQLHQKEHLDSPLNLFPCGKCLRSTCQLRDFPLRAVYISGRYCGVYYRVKDQGQGRVRYEVMRRAQKRGEEKRKKKRDEKKREEEKEMRRDKVATADGRSTDD